MRKQFSTNIFLFICLSVWTFACSKNKSNPVNQNESELQTTGRDSVPRLLGEERIPSYEAYCVSIPVGEEIEYFELNWPGDDRLCESYEGSDGPLTFRIYRLKESKRIVQVYEEGAFCQGDSDFGYYYLFDEKGNAVYYEEVALSPHITFFESGKPIIEVEFDSEFDPTDFRKITNATSTETIHASVYENKIETYRETMRKRSSTLRDFIAKTNDADDINEAETLIDSLQSSLRKKIIYRNEYIFRKPLPSGDGNTGELALVNGRDIRVMEAPHANSPVIYKVSYYCNNIMVMDIQGMEEIQPYGKHPWYKIHFTDWSTDTPKEAEGWIFGAFVANSVYTKQ